MNYIFERTQWAVGHGGFHAGKLASNGLVLFNYFYDCGSKEAKESQAKKNITKSLAETTYDFGVLSHFDNDHVSEILTAKEVKILFLPYMSPADYLLYILSYGTAVKDMKSASKIYANLKALIGKKIRVVMVRHVDDRSDDGILISVPIDSTSREFQDGVEVIDDTGERVFNKSGEPILKFRFYNYYPNDLSSALKNALDNFIEEGKFLDIKGVVFKSDKDFFSQLGSNPTGIIDKNHEQLINLQVKIAKDSGVRNITPKNLSSLTLYSHCNNNRYDIFANELSSREQRFVNAVRSGWMLTGDLELLEGISENFRDHYGDILDEILVFNIPHHASSQAFDKNSLCLLSRKSVFISSVKDGDEHHPSLRLYKKMSENGFVAPHNVSEVQSSTFSVRINLKPRRFSRSEYYDALRDLLG